MKPEVAAALVVEAMMGVDKIGPRRARELCREYLHGQTGNAQPRYVAAFVDIMATPTQRRSKAFAELVGERAGGGGA